MNDETQPRAVPASGARDAVFDRPPTDADRRIGPSTMVLSHNLRRLLDGDDTAVALFGFDGTTLDANEAMLRLLGASEGDTLLADAAVAGVLQSFLDQIPTDLFEDDGIWHGRIDHQTRTGERRVLRATASSIVGASSETHEVALLLHDVTAPEQRLAQLAHRVSHDALTGLANRERMLHGLRRAIAERRHGPGRVAAILLDVDHLKYVNDSLGHRAGDGLLVSAAQRLSQAIRPTDDIARIGGDEFVVIANDIDDPTSALDLAERARRALAGHLRIGELDLDVSVSIGVALSDADVLSRSDDDAAALLIGNADTAMYESKRNGRNRCTLFTPPMRSNARHRTEIAALLAHAISQGDVDVAYQPIFSTVSQSAVAAEALVRWAHPDNIDTLALIGIAEESGTIGSLGDLVLERSLADLREWTRLRIVDDEFSVHVNVSRVQLASPSFVNRVLDLLARNGLAPPQLVLEARESPLLSHEPNVVRTIHALRRSGVRVAVDNFGTGPKALAVLTDVGADVLKLDGSLALPAGASDADVRLVRAIVLLAHALEMRVVAERVSAPEQLQRLQAAGCDMAQGNLLAQPTGADDLPLASTTSW